MIPSYTVKKGLSGLTRVSELMEESATGVKNRGPVIVLYNELFLDGLNPSFLTPTLFYFRADMYIVSLRALEKGREENFCCPRISSSKCWLFNVS